MFDYFREKKRKKIVPLVKAANPPIEAGKKVVEVSPPDRPIVDSFVGDLCIVYGLDKGSHFVWLTARDCKRLHIEPSELRLLAQTNLQLYHVEIHSYKHLGIFAPKINGNLEASLLLLDPLWESVQKDVQGEIVAAVPHRDVLAFTGSASKEGIASLRNTIEEAFTDLEDPFSGHFISKNLFVRRQGKWELFNS